MTSISAGSKRDEPSNLRFIETSRPVVDETREVVASLSEQPPRLSPKYFYDSQGSELFEAITELPEYYLTRAEAEIFGRHLDEIVEALGVADVIIEPGSGNCSKVLPLLERALPHTFVPIDIAGNFLWEAAKDVARQLPELSVTAIAADFTRDWTFTQAIPAGHRIVFYPGSTLGNFEPDAQRDFITQLARVVGARGAILLGIDLHKDGVTLQQAYDDTAGVTAAFNRNILRVVNERAGADFKPDQWRHEARYNPDLRRIEMDLIAESEDAISVGGQGFVFPPGAAIRTEHSYKFTLEDIQHLAAHAGLSLAEHWLDNQSRFCLALLVPGTAYP